MWGTSLPLCWVQTVEMSVLLGTWALALNVYFVSCFVKTIWLFAGSLLRLICSEHLFSLYKSHWIELCCIPAGGRSVPESVRETNLFIFGKFPEEYSTSLTQPSHPKTVCCQRLTSFLLQSSSGKQPRALKTADRRVLVGRPSALELPTGRQSAPAVGTELSLPRHR